MDSRELVRAEDETGSGEEDEDVSEDEDVIEIESECDSEFEDEPVPEEAPHPPSGGAPRGSCKSRDGRVEWFPSPVREPSRSGVTVTTTAAPGPTQLAVTHVHDILSSFELLIPESILEMIRGWTNLEGRRVLEEQWKDVDLTHLRAYLGVLLLAGVYRSRGESTASLWDPETGRAIFGATMSLQSFHMFSRVLRFAARESGPGRRRGDKLAAIRPLWDEWAARLPALYRPGPGVTLDKRLLAFRGRCPFRQFLPSKPAKCGIKVWTACDAASSYAWRMLVYTGTPEGAAPGGARETQTVLELTRGLRGHVVTCDQLLTTYDVGQELLSRELTMVGPVRRNRPELPPQILSVRNRPVHSSRFMFTADTALVSYIPKKGKNVVLMSTRGLDGAVSEREDRRPEVVLDHEATRGGVEALDALLSRYSCKRRTLRWPLVIFFDILDVSAHNAFVLWTALRPGWQRKQFRRRRLFLEELGKALVTPHIQRRQHVPRNPAALAIVRRVKDDGGVAPASPPETAARKRKRCALCPPSRDYKTQTTCSNCHKFICGGHTLKFCSSCVL
ncbi:piggyBac transposable element-derived protein 4-like [Cololabis saira]|uniref:piggyBac transposable element-derived protein 4-like n=1 Tax=Cololabis saira TaxID=129043 RepID=UPI002AD3E544|nr:piggyBac transposable element-derived protein 4-like [Cololabis saira]